MANLTSKIIDNRNASPQEFSGINESPDGTPSGTTTTSYVNGGRLRRKAAVIATGGNQTDGATARFFTVKSSDVIHSLLTSGDALTGFSDINIGIYLTDGGAAVSESLFKDNDTSMASATVREERRVGADSALGIETLGQAVWQLAGLTADPHVPSDITWTMVDAGSDSGDLVTEMLYTAGD